MIGYFVSVGDAEIDELFSPYLWGEFGLAKTIKQELKDKKYGHDLDLLLIEYYVEGKFVPLGSEKLKGEDLRVLNYSRKEKAISVAVAVRFPHFHDREQMERKKFLIKTTLAAIDSVREKLEKRGVDTNFDALRQDVDRVGNLFLNAAPEIKEGKEY